MPVYLELVNVAEVVAAGGIVLQGNSKQGRVELRLDSVEEGGLRLRANSVDGAESEAEQTVVVHILLELKS